MKNLFQKSKFIIMRGMPLFVSLCLFLVVILQIGLLVAVNALNTGKAHNFIQTQVTSALAASGYNATFDKLFYDPARGFTVYNFIAADKDGVFVTADRISVDVAFLKMPLKQLNIIASAGKINFIRAPISQPEKKQVAQGPSLQPFSMPNIYFNTINIMHLSIDSLNVAADVAGQDISFSPVLKAVMKINDALDFDAVLLTKPSRKLESVSFPEKVELVGSLSPTLLFALNKLSIASPDYQLSGNGNGQLIQDGKMNITLNAEYPDLKEITQENIDSAHLSLTVEGTYNLPVIRMNGTIVPAALKEKGLSDIILSATTDSVAEGLSGNIDITTSYLKEPISLAALLKYKDDILNVESVKGTAPEIMLDGSGLVSAQNTIFDGKLSVTVADLSYYKSLLSYDIAGALKIDAILKPLNKVQALDVNLSATKIKFETTRISKADADLHFSDISWLWPQTGTVKIANLSLSDTISLNNAEANIKDMGGNVYNLSIDGLGNFPSAASFKGMVNISDILNDLPTLRDIDFKATLGNSSIYLAGTLDKDNIGLTASTKNFLMADISSELPDTLKTMRLNGSAVMTGAPASPLTKVHFIGNGIDTGAYKNLEIVIDANHQNGRADVALSGKGSAIKTLRANVSLPMIFSLFPFAFDIDGNAQLSGDMMADLDLGALSPLFLPPTQKFMAGLKANANIGGVLSEPDMKGALAIQDGQFLDDQNGIRLESLNLNSSFVKDGIAIETLSATDGEKGRMSGSGYLGFGSGKNTDISLVVKKFHLPASHMADGMVDADFSLSNTASGYDLKGTIDIDHINIMIPETFESKIPELNIVERKKETGSNVSGQLMTLAVKVNAPSQIFVRGWGLDAEFGGELNISGDTATPIFNGNLISKRGRYEEFGKRFSLARANLRFQGELPPSPYLDIEAKTTVDDITASVILAGPVVQPSIRFSSTPALPQDEVLSRILFGRNTAKISPFQAIQLAKTLKRFSGEGGDGGLNPIDMLRSATGLDDISIDIDANGETNVGVGKYLTDKVYLEFEKGKAANSGGANIQIEVTPSINVQSEIGQDAQAGGGIFWKRDY